jgi:hypothetical protein
MSRSYTPLPTSASMACSGTAFITTDTLLCRGWFETDVSRVLGFPASVLSFGFEIN